MPRAAIRSRLLDSEAEVVVPVPLNVLLECLLAVSLFLDGLLDVGVTVNVFGFGL